MNREISMGGGSIADIRGKQTQVKQPKKQDIVIKSEYNNGWVTMVRSFSFVSYLVVIRITSKNSYPFLSRLIYLMFLHSYEKQLQSSLFFVLVLL